MLSGIFEIPVGWALPTIYIKYQAVILYSGYWLSEVQKPHPQPPPRKRGGGYDIPHVIRKCYIFD